MRRAAERLIPVSLEFGGKDPMIVLKDADLERAAGACVWGALMNSGQICTSIERVYVEAPIYQSFVDKVVARVRAIKQGASADTVDIGCMTSEEQLKKVAAQVDEAVARGAKALTGGRRNPDLPGYYYEPTVLVDVDHSMNSHERRNFWPDHSARESRRRRRSAALGQRFALRPQRRMFSRDAALSQLLAEGLQSGSVCINDSLVSFIVADAPMGGRKDSGFGYRHGAEGIRKFCQQKTIVTDKFGLKEEFPWYPATAKKAHQVRHLLNLLCHTGWRHKLRALKGLAGG